MVRGCPRSADLLCDGHSDETNPDTAKPSGCDLPICHDHATQIAEDEHLCPRCEKRAREVFGDLARRCQELGDLARRHELPPLGESWPELHRGAYLIVQERPSSVLWFVSKGGGAVYRLAIDAAIRWELEKLPGVLDLALLLAKARKWPALLGCGRRVFLLRGAPGDRGAPPVNADRAPGAKTFA